LVKIKIKLIYVIMEKSKIEIRSIWGKILFEFEKEDNSIKGTLLEAIKKDAYLRGADLRGADLRGADLRGADLRDADLRDAFLQGADLRGADLQGAYLRDAYLQGADLRDAYLQGADLQDAKIDDIEKYKSNFWIIPEQGSFEAWKKLANNSLAKLLIPAKAKRTCNLKNRKCRAEYVKVLAIWNEDGKKITEGKSKGEGDAVTVKYTVGKITKADSFDDSILIDCSHGIHFFVTKQEAKDY
jgi:hypothetical protein